VAAAAAYHFAIEQDERRQRSVALPCDNGAFSKLDRLHQLRIPKQKRRTRTGRDDPSHSPKDEGVTGAITDEDSRYR
jgi:hypothetical protein